MGLSEFVRQAHISSYGARVAVELSMRHGMDVGHARELVRNVPGSIELMYADGLSPVLVARRLVLAARDGITDPTAVARALTDQCIAAGATPVRQEVSDR
jgi:hypothetical protein